MQVAGKVTRQEAVHSRAVELLETVARFRPHSIVWPVWRVLQGKD